MIQSQRKRNEDCICEMFKCSICSSVQYCKLSVSSNNGMSLKSQKTIFEVLNKINQQNKRICLVRSFFN